MGFVQKDPESTDGPRGNFLVWSFSENLRIALKDISSIEHAAAGVDFPTDGPSNLNRDFLVAVDVYGNRFPLNQKN